MHGYKMNKKLGLLLFKFVGDVTLRQIGELLQEAAKDPDYSPALNVLTDARKFSSIFSYDDMHEFASRLPDHPGNAVRPKNAVLVGKDVTFGMGRVWEVIAEYKTLRAEMRVFRDLGAALEWLGLPAGTALEFPF